MSGKDRRPILLLKWLFALTVLFVLGVFVMVKIDPTLYAAEYSVRSDLKYLANVQAEYFDEHDEYTEDLTALGFFSSDGVTIRLEAVDGGWAATGTFHIRSPSPQSRYRLCDRWWCPERSLVGRD